MKKGTNIICAVFVLFICLAMVPMNVTAAEDEVKIGAVFPLSGPLALMGTENCRGVEMAVDYVNKHGGVWGKQVKLIKVDIPDQNTARSETERLISVEDVKLVFGTYSSGHAYVASTITEQKNVIYVEVNAIADTLTQRNYKYFFRTSATASQFSIGACDFAKEALAPRFGIDPKKLKVAIIYEDSLFGTSCGTAAEKRAKELGLNVVSVESYNKKVSDLSPLIMKLKMKKPDIIIATQYITDALLFQRQSKEANFYVKAIIGTGGGFGMTDFPKGVGNAINGIFTSDFPLLKNPKMLDADMKPGLVEVHNMYRDRYNNEPTLFAMAGFIGGMTFLTEVLPKAGSMDPDAIREAAISLDIPTGRSVMGWGIKFAAEDGHPMRGQNLNTFTAMMQYQDGQLYSVYPKRYAEKEIILSPLPQWKDR